MSVLQGVAQLTTTQLVNCFVFGAAIAMLAGTASALGSQRSSGMRFAIWFAALVAIASLFFLPSRVAQAAAASRASIPAISLPTEWALYIFFVWALLAAIGLGRVAYGLVRVRSLKRSCVPVEPLLSATFEGKRRFKLCTSDHVRVPVALGFFHPVIVLPAWAVRELSPEELHIVVLHEAAHLERWDDWTNLTQKLIRALLFFHPAVWWIDSRLSIEREMSCDDMVLAHSRNARQYAACLISLAEKTHAHRSLALVQAAVSHLRHTARRISKILNGQERTAKPLLKPALVAIAIFGTISLLAVENTPQLVSFRDTKASSARSASADKFDYVATVNPPAGRATTASLHVASSATVPRATLKREHHSNKAGAPVQPGLDRQPMPTEEAQRFEKRSPAVVNAAIRGNAVPSFVYVVTQFEQIDRSGNVTVTTAVWRIRVLKPAPAPAQSTVVPHQT